MRLKTLRLKSKITNTINILLISNLIILLGFFIVIKNTLAESKEEFVITEVMYNPEGKSSENSDWIEIFALNDFIINKDWRIMDEFNINKISGKNKGSRNTCHTIKNNLNENFKKNDFFKIKKEEFVIFADNVKRFKKQYPKYKGAIFDTTLNLQTRNNDAVRISKNKCINFINEVKYNPKEYDKNKGYSLEWDFKDKKWRESYKKGGTPGEQNSKKSKLKKYSDKIRINEILPNPSGSEKENEFIELYNFGNKDIDLENWVIKDNSKKGQYIFTKNTRIKAGEYVVIYRKKFKFALNNSGGEKVFLLNPNRKKVFEIDYKSAKENISYGFDDKNKKWRWSNKLTPGKNNLFSNIPIIRLKISKKKYKNVYVNFKVDVKNIKGNKFKVKWNFGDGKKSYLKKTKHKYQKVGKYNGSVEILNKGEVFRKEFQLKVRKYPHQKIKIIAIMPNPKGKDSEFEWIKIKNKSKKKINLKGWSVATGISEKKMINHPIYNKLIIKSGESKKITRKYSKFSLNNKKSRIEIKYPDGKIAYYLKYKKDSGIKNGEVYKKKKGRRWFWMETIIKPERVKNFNKKVNHKIREINKREYIKKDKISVNNGKNEIEDVKNQSLIDKKLTFKKYFNFENIKNIKNDYNKITLLKNNQKVLGDCDNSIKKIRIENNIYYFIPKTKQQEYYLKKFFKKLINLIFN